MLPDQPRYNPGVFASGSRRRRFTFRPYTFLRWHRSFLQIRQHQHGARPSASATSPSVSPSGTAPPPDGGRAQRHERRNQPPAGPGQNSRQPSRYRLRPRTRPAAATGEQASSALLAIRCRPKAWSRQLLGLAGAHQTDSSYTKARIESIEDARVSADLNAGKVVIITGFQGIDPQGNVTTLGRGGSDTSAVAVAAALEGRRVPDLHRRRRRLHHRPARGYPGPAHGARQLRGNARDGQPLGSKVLQIRSVEFAGKYRCPDARLSSFTPRNIDLNEEARSGTLITFEEDENMEQAVVSGIAFNRDEAKVSVLGVPDTLASPPDPGRVADANIEVDVIIQNVSRDGKTDFRLHRAPQRPTPADPGPAEGKGPPALGAAEVVATRASAGQHRRIGMRSRIGVASRCSAA